MTERFANFLKSFLLFAVIASIVCLLVAAGFLLISSELSGTNDLFHEWKVSFLWFGVPMLIYPIIEAIWPRLTSDTVFGISAGVYYGGAVLSKVLGAPAGFIISVLLGYLYIVKVAPK